MNKNMRIFAGILIFVLIIISISINHNIYHINDNDSEIRARENFAEVLNNFTELNNKNVVLKMGNINDGSAESIKWPFENYVVTLDINELNNLSDDGFRGLFAHEFSHLVSYKNKSWIEMIWFGIKYSISDEFKTDVERETDTTTVLHGYGNDSYAYLEYRLETASEEDRTVYAKYYLSLDEIKNLTEVVAQTQNMKSITV